MENQEGKVNVKQIVRRSVYGALVLVTRQVLLQIIGFATINVLLARVLPVSLLGTFNIANYVLSFFTFFSDIGLGAALIQKKDALLREDVTTTFTIQEILATIITISVWFAAPYFSANYKLGVMGMWLIRTLAIAFILSSLKSIPAVLLERELKFQPLVIVDTLESVIFNVALVVLVFSHFGLLAFIIASLLRSVIGTIAIYILAPWQVGFGFSKKSYSKMLSFGIPFQVNSLLALLKDNLVDLIIAGMVGSTGVGFITWAQSWALKPLDFLNILITVTFPAYARMQDDKVLLKKALERSIFITTALIYPALFGLAAIIPKIVLYIVSSKWQPALPLFYLFCLSSLWATLSTTFTNTLNAVGKVKTTLKLMVMWTALTWILTPILTLKFGMIGVALTSAIISFTSVATIIAIKRVINVEVFKSIWEPFTASFLMAGTVYLISSYFVTNLFTLIVVIILGVLIYLGLMIVLAKNKVLEEVKTFRNALV